MESDIKITFSYDVQSYSNYTYICADFDEDLGERFTSFDYDDIRGIVNNNITNNSISLLHVVSRCSGSRLIIRNLIFDGLSENLKRIIKIIKDVIFKNHNIENIVCKKKCGSIFFIIDHCVDCPFDTKKSLSEECDDIFTEVTGV